MKREIAIKKLSKSNYKSITMKKLLFAIAISGFLFTSCGNKTKTAASEDKACCPAEKTEVVVKKAEGCKSDCSTTCTSEAKAECTKDAKATATKACCSKEKAAATTDAKKECKADCTKDCCKK